MKKLLSKLIFVISLLIPTAVFAHEQWFAGTPEMQSPLPYFFVDWSAARIAITIGFVVLLIVSLFIGPFINKFKISKKIEEKVTSVSAFAPQLVRGAIGILMIMASSQGLLFAPDLHLKAVPLAFSISLWVLQYVVGFAFVLGIFMRPAAAISILLYGAAFAFFPLKNLLSYLSLAGIFVYLFAIGNPSNVGFLFCEKLRKINSWLAAHEVLAMKIMRILFGLSFISMGILFKLTTPQMSLAILAVHPVINFLAQFGFTNEMFVYAAGLSYVLFGILYIFNILPRIVSLKLIGLFTATIFVFGLGELFGHIPLLAGFFAILTQKQKES